MDGWVVGEPAPPFLIEAEPSPEGIREAVAATCCSHVVREVRRLDEILMDNTASLGFSIVVVLPDGVRVHCMFGMERLA